MATFNNKEIIKTMLENNGTYPGDPQAVRIYEYTNVPSGEVMWAVFYKYSDNDIYISPFVTNPILLFGLSGGITKNGRKFLENYERA